MIHLTETRIKIPHASSIRPINNKLFKDEIIPMIKKLLLYTIFFILGNQIKAGNNNHPVGARAGAMAGSSVTLSDVWSTYHNQAGLAHISGITAGVYYENRFAVKELSTKGAAFAMPYKNGAFGLSVTQFGYSLYNENKVGLAYSQKFGEVFSAGVQLNYLGTFIAEGYGQRHAVAAELGVLANLTKELKIGAHIYNPTRTKLAQYNNERTPTIFRLGLNYRFSKQVFITAETEKSTYLKPQLKAGLEYKFNDYFYLRMGVANNPNIIAFGFGINMQNLQFDFGASHNAVLGYVPQFGLSYVPSEGFKLFNKKSNTNSQI
jgi:hypothetical protein